MKQSLLTSRADPATFPASDLLSKPERTHQAIRQRGVSLVQWKINCEIGRLVEITIDRGRLVEKIDRLQIDQEYLEDSGGDSIN